MDIFPSVLTHTPYEFSAQLHKLLPFFDKVQIDIADNILVEGSTPSTFEALQLLISSVYIKKVTVDFHLMVKDYSSHLSLLEDAHLKLKLRFALIHHAAKPDPQLFIRQPYSYQLGIVLNPEDDVQTIKQIYALDKIPTIQIMTVVPGAQGKPFLPDMLNKIEQLRINDYRGIILLDGGINASTLPLILHKKYRPDAVCPGSYFSASVDVPKDIRELHNITEQVSGEKKSEQ